MHQHSGKSLFIAALLAGALGYSSGANAGCVPSVTSTSNYATCVGFSALKNNANSSYYNTAMGAGALYSNTTGMSNTSVGSNSLFRNVSGYDNSAMGSSALYSNTTGNNNISVGGSALFYNTTGSNNAAAGTSALYSNTTGGANSAMGTATLYLNTTGSNNVAVGYKAGYSLTTGSNNIDIANQGVAGDSATIRIGTPGTQTKTFIAGIYGSAVSGPASAIVTVNNLGQLGVASSSRRYKEDIKAMGNVSDKLLELRPVTFHYKKADEDGKKPIQYGLIAEEVDAVMPELVVRNKDGSPETVAYQYIPSLLLNEYQKQHKELVAEKAELSETKAKLANVEKLSALQETNAKASAQKMAEMQSQIDKLNAITKKLMAALPATTKTAMAK